MFVATANEEAHPIHTDYRAVFNHLPILLHSHRYAERSFVKLIRIALQPLKRKTAPIETLYSSFSAA